MRLTAIRSAGDAIDLTRSFLTAQTVKRYVLLAVMAVFLGPAGVSGPPGPVQIQQDFRQDIETGVPELGELFDLVTAELIVTMIAIIGAIAMLYALASALMEFAFVHSLSTQSVALAEPIATYWRQALALFVFRAVIWGATVGMIALVSLSVLDIIAIPGDPAIVSLVVGAFAVGIVAYLLNRLTTDFVVPIMYKSDRGLVWSWGQFLGVARRNLRQYVAYVPIRIILEIAMGVVFAIVIGLTMVGVAIVVGLPLGFLLWLTLGMVGLAILAVVLVLVAICVFALLIVPFHTYLRYYTLLVLGDTDETYDLVPEMRAASRSGGLS